MPLAVVIAALISFANILPKSGQTSPAPSVGDVVQAAINKGRLVASDGTPFYLKAQAEPANARSAGYTAEIEEYWVAPDKWRRTIRSKQFEQTIIVNGAQRYESNSSDYLPKWLDDICVSLFEVAPRYFVEEVRTLGERNPGRDINTGGPEWKFERVSTAGGGSIISWGVVSIDRTRDVMTFALGTGFTAGYRDHRDFHGRTVARVVETFPRDPGGDVLTKIIALDDLEHPDEGLSAIPEPTPREKRLAIVHVAESDLRKLEINHPTMNWPKVGTQPTSGTLVTHVVIDREGRVRECDFGVSHNMALSNGTCDLVKQWRFKPTLVDGVPVQVNSTLTFEFLTEIAGDQAKYRAASAYFKQARDLTFPRTGESVPFHLKATFQGEGPLAQYKGVYEEWWFSPDHWRRHVKVGNIVVMQSRIDDDLYGPITSKPFPDRAMAIAASKAMDLITGDFPGYEYFSPDTDWRMHDVQFDDTAVLRISMGRTEDLPKGEYPHAYYLLSDGRMHATTQGKEMILYSDYADFEKKLVPRRTRFKLGGAPWLTTTIDLLEKTDAKEDEFLEIKGVKPRDSSRPVPR